MESSHLMAGIGTGLCGGLLSGLFGVGGGVVMVPLLGLTLHLDQHRAQGATLAAMLLPTGLPAVLQYRSRGHASSLTLVGVLILAFLAGITGGSLVANRLPSELLRWGFVTFLVLLALQTFLRQEPSPNLLAMEAKPAGPELWSKGLPIGLLAGVVSGLTGLGGAVVVVPLLASRFRMTQHEAQLTSLMMLLPPIGLPGVLIYAKAQGGLPWVAIAGVALGFSLGALGGARVATRLSSPRLKRWFGVIVLLMALLVALRVR